MVARLRSRTSSSTTATGVMWPSDAEIRRAPSSGTRPLSALTGPGGLGLLVGGGGGLVRCFDDLALDVDRDLVAHDELAVQDRVEVHAEVLAVDLGLRGVADAVTHARVVELAVADDVEGHGPGRALDRQVAGDLELVVAGLLDLRALEAHGRVLVDFEEV